MPIPAAEQDVPAVGVTLQLKANVPPNATVGLSEKPPLAPLIVMSGAVGAGAATERVELQEVYVEQPVDVWLLGFLTKSM